MSQHLVIVAQLKNAEESQKFNITLSLNITPLSDAAGNISGSSSRFTILPAVRNLFGVVDIFSLTGLPQQTPAIDWRNLAPYLSITLEITGLPIITREFQVIQKHDLTTAISHTNLETIRPPEVQGDERIILQQGQKLEVSIQNKTNIFFTNVLLNISGAFFD